MQRIDCALMTPPRTMSILVTGATRGLGLSTATALGVSGAHTLVAGRDPSAAAHVADEVGGQSIVLDFADLAAVRSVAKGLARGEYGRVDAVVLNAAVQLPGAIATTADGFETTFQVNYFAQLLLADALLAGDFPPQRIVFVGSSSHDPSRSTLPAPWEGSVHRAAAGQVGPPDSPDNGMRRYTTSKLLNTAAALGLARQHPDVDILCFDPGAMLATGLYRQHSVGQRTMFALAARLVARRRGFSTPANSGSALARLAVAGSIRPAGHAVNPDGTSTPVSLLAANHEYQNRVLRESRELIASSAADV